MVLEANRQSSRPLNLPRLRSSRHQRAQRIGRKRIAGRRIGSRARAPAQQVKLALTAPSVELAGIVQRSEEIVAPIDVHQPVSPHVTRGQRKKTRRAHIAALRYEHHPVAIANPEPARGRAPFDRLAGKTFAAHLLNGDAPVGRRFGGGDEEWRLLASLVNPTHQVFGLSWLERLQHFAATHRNEEEQAPARDLVGDEQV